MLKVSLRSLSKNQIPIYNTPAVHKARPDVHAACHAHSTYGKAFSVFGRPLDMITQDSLRFYKSHAVYTDFGGVVLDREEGRRIAKSLGDGKACILQNHGLLTVGKSVDEAAFWFMSLDKTCHAQCTFSTFVDIMAILTSIPSTG